MANPFMSQSYKSVTDSVSTAASNASAKAATAVSDAAGAVKNKAASLKATVKPPVVPAPPSVASVKDEPDGYDYKFSHKTNNIVTTTSDDDLRLSTDFRSNILDNYDTSTYHWKFFITTTEASSTGKIFDQGAQTIIAESGVSDLTIDKVEIRSITTPSVECGTGTSTEVKFEIVEPAGAGLIDKIFYESVALGIGNWSVMPIYLQLQFKARTPDFSEADSGTPGELGSLRWIWALRLRDIKANVSTVGTRYEFSAIIYSELAQSNAYSTMQHPIVLEELQNFGDAMDKLRDKLNEDQAFKLLGFYSIPDTYKIVVDSKLKGHVFSMPNNNEDSLRNSSFTSYDGKNASFAQATSIDKIIDSLLSQTKQYQESLTGAATPGGEGKKMTAEISQMKKFWRIITESRPIKFDARRNDYSKEFTIFVIEYDLGVLESNVMQNTSPPITAAAERKRLATYLKKSILKKKYNYIFTGLNDQVINFDIKLNNAYATSLARMNGIYVNSAMADKSMVYQDNAAEEATFTYKLNAVANFQNTGTSLRASDNQIDKFEEAKAKLAAATQTPAQVRLRDLLLSKQKPKDMLAFLNQVQNSGGLTVEGELTEPLPFAKSLATPLAGTDIKFISDVNTSEESIKEAYNDYLLGIKGKLRPVTYIDSMHQQQIGQGITSNSNSGIQQVSTMFAVALHSNIDSSFMHIHLTIKGDPFWLFPQPVVDDDARLHNALKPEAEAIEWIKEAHMKTRDSVNIYGSDNFLLLRFRTPRIFDTNDNPDTTNPFTDVEMLSGVFKVTEITHKFESGKFTQDIACYLDTQINITNFTNEIENDAAVPTPETTTAEATIDSIPPTASKTQKLAKPSALDKIKNKVNGAVANVTSAAKGVTDKASALAAEGMAKAPNIGVVISTNTPQPLPSPIQGLPPKYD